MIRWREPESSLYSELAIPALHPRAHLTDGGYRFPTLLEVSSRRFEWPAVLLQ